MRHNIPRELQELAQWVCAGPNKIPICPRTAQPASPTDPSTWGSFADACASSYPHIGLVLTKEDPYAIIDLDKPANQEQAARHSQILKAFDSYSEVSQSGEGVHIVVKGALEHGVRRDKVEAYSSERYMIFTGRVLHDRPIMERQELLDVLYREMASTAHLELEERESNLSDEQIVDMACNAANADKFNRLCSGDITGYPSQSEADFALLSILSFYSPSNEQVRRLFRYTALGKRKKAQRDSYLNTALKKIRALQPPPVDLQSLRSLQHTQNIVSSSDATVEVVSPEQPAPVSLGSGKHAVEGAADVLVFPPGLAGAIADYILASAVRPVREVALAGSLALLAGIIGRSYNVSGTGLNQYIILLAGTGTGKEGAATGIETLLGCVRSKVPMADQFMGPSTFASGQAMIKVLDERPCFVSVLGEVGMLLQQICSPRANSAERVLKRVLLDLYTKSGWSSVLRSSVYSDKEKNTKIVQAPSVTLLGESTPQAFYESLDDSHIAEGLIPRFMTIEYTGKRPARNEHAFEPPSVELVQGLADLATVALTTQQNNQCAAVGAVAEAQEVLGAFDLECDAQINSAGSDAAVQLWNRAHLKALKLAALVSVGVDLHQPIIQEAHAQWAVQCVRDSTLQALRRVLSGDMGTGEQRQHSELLRMAHEWEELSVHSKFSYRLPKACRDFPRIIPSSYFRMRCRRLKPFTEDRRGPAKAVEAALDMMVEEGVMGRVPDGQALADFGAKQALYYLDGDQS